MKQIFITAGIAVVLLQAGCTGPGGLYYWGDYESQLYRMYIEPGEAPPERQIELLEADIEVARSKGRPLPPGYRAHLGMLYFQQGNPGLARQAFEAEKAAFPESTSLMDQFIKQMEGNDV